MSWGHFVLGTFCHGDILSLGTFCPGAFCPWGYFVRGHFVMGTFCAGTLCPRGQFVMGTIWKGDILSGDIFYMGTFFTWGYFVHGDILSCYPSDSFLYLIGVKISIFRKRNFIKIKYQITIVDLLNDGIQWSRDRMEEC